jgi:hypothetical protein
VGRKPGAEVLDGCSGARRVHASQASDGVIGSIDGGIKIVKAEVVTRRGLLSY